MLKCNNLFRHLSGADKEVPGLSSVFSQCMNTIPEQASHVRSWHLPRII